MATTTYTVINGVIVHEDRNGTQRNYRPDTLGNTVALTDATTTTDTMTYWPYGEIRTRTGTNATRFLFVGTLGYSKDGGFGLHYVRARYYQANRGRWVTVDPLWPGESAYGYAKNNPFRFVDSDGKELVAATAATGLVIAGPPGWLLLACVVVVVACVAVVVCHKPDWTYDPIGRPWDKPKPGDRIKPVPVPPHEDDCETKYFECIFSGKGIYQGIYCSDCLGMCRSWGRWRFDEPKCNYR